MSPKSTHPAVVVSDLIYQYPTSTKPAVAMESLRVEPDQQVVLTGPSGCGKSTLLHLISGLMDPTSGQIEIVGTDLAQLHGSRRDRFRGRHIGMVFQTFQLLHGFSAIENVLAALMFSDIRRAGHRARALSLLESLGIETPNARVEDLSIGQQQRVAVARASACSPAVILADEPTAALDPGFSSIAMDLLQDACRRVGAALICVTHDVSMISRFDRHQSLDAMSPVGIGV